MEKSITLLGIESLEDKSLYPWASPEAAVESEFGIFDYYDMGVESFYSNITISEYMSLDAGTEGVWQSIKDFGTWIKNLFKKLWAWITGANKTAKKEAADAKQKVGDALENAKAAFDELKGCWAPSKEFVDYVNKVNTPERFKAVDAMYKVFDMCISAKSFDELQSGMMKFQQEYGVEFGIKNQQDFNSTVSQLKKAQKPEFIKTSVDEAIGRFKTLDAFISKLVGIQNTLKVKLEKAGKNVEKIASSTPEEQLRQIEGYGNLPKDEIVKRISKETLDGIKEFQNIFRLVINIVKKICIACNIRNKKKQPGTEAEEYDVTGLESVDFELDLFSL